MKQYRVEYKILNYNYDEEALCNYLCHALSPKDAIGQTRKAQKDQDISIIKVWVEVGDELYW